MEKIVHLKKSNDEKIACFSRSKQENAQNILKALYEHPLVTVNDTAQICGTSFPTANRLIADLCDLGILKEMSGQSRNRFFLMKEYVDVFRDLS